MRRVFQRRSLETLKDGFNSCTLELFSRIEDTEPAFISDCELHSSSKFGTGVPEIPEQLRASEIEVVQNWSQLWHDYASAKRINEFIKYLTYDKSLRKPRCSEIGTDSLDPLIRELGETIDIWKEKKRSARTLRDDRSSFCEACVPSHDKAREEKFERRYFTANCDKSSEEHAKE